MYSQEAASLLRDITMYRALLEKQGRIVHDDELYCVRLEQADWSLLAAVWVLVDFIERVEYHGQLADHVYRELARKGNKRQKQASPCIPSPELLSCQRS